MGSICVHFRLGVTVSCVSQGGVVNDGRDESPPFRLSFQGTNSLTVDLSESV